MTWCTVFDDSKQVLFSEIQWCKFNVTFKFSVVETAKANYNFVPTARKWSITKRPPAET